MLARSGRLPRSGDYAFEVKWDGFRAIVSTEGSLRVRSRRGWDIMRRTTAPLTFMAFDVLSVDGRSVMGLPYSERREILDGLALNDRFWKTPERSTTARRCGRPCANTNSRASSRRSVPAATCAVSAA
jgi:ATP-dependent DNA ligase